VVLGDKNRFWDRDYSLPTPAKSAMSLYLEQDKKWQYTKKSFQIYYVIGLLVSFVFLNISHYSRTQLSYQQEKQHLQHQIDSLQRENKRLLEENKQLRNK
jgi:hypothetical protein